MLAGVVVSDAAAWPVVGAIKVFPEEFDFYIANGRSMVESDLVMVG